MKPSALNPPKMPGKTGQDDSQRLVFFVWGGIGNMVMALPAIKAVQKNIPGAKVFLIAQKQVMLELMDISGLETALALDDPNYRGLKGLLRLLGALKKLNAQAAITSLPFPGKRYGLLALATGARKRICDDWAGAWGCNVRIKPVSRHYLERNLEMLRGLGLDEKFDGFDLPVDAGSLRQAREFLDQQKIDSSKLIVLHPGSGNARRRWSSHNFIGLGQDLVRRKHQIAVIGGFDEGSLVQEVAGGIGPGAHSYVRLLKPTLALIRQSAFFIGNDSGLAHCAAALNIPTTVIFGPTDPGQYRPYGARVKVIKSAAACSPCYRPGGKFSCRQDIPFCLSRITVKEVMEGFDEISQKQ
jgi:ADP-heptose:LPS heptosyltransferase